METPQSVKDKLPCWYFHLFLLFVVVILKAFTGSPVGILISVLMALLCVMIVWNKMEKAANMVMPYAVVCVLNFVLELLKLYTRLNGRYTGKIQQHDVKGPPGVDHVTFTRYIRKFTFFDSSLGWAYNMQSAVMILAPVATLLGAYLSIKAIFDIQRSVPVLPGLDDEARIGVPFAGRALAHRSYGNSQGSGHR